MIEPQVEPGGRRPAHFQPHIQGLRAIAVLLVVVYHIWPGRLTGGYVGVDVFFVVSGFLITGQLARELQRTGRIALPSFWAKRVRRLLPASITVLVFCALAMIFILPMSSLPAEVRELLASTFYVENWALALSSVDYLALQDATTTQHYWSLSLEEQFYVLWPLLLLGATWLGVRFVAAKRWFSLVTVVAVVTVASLATSILYTATNPAEAYFVTFTRIWEFGIGALLVLLPKLRPRGAWAHNIVGYTGLAMILAAGWFFDRDTLFPGYTALLPVIGTALVITADRRERWWDVGSVLSGRPQRFIGDVSYSMYLWHWPLIIAAPYVPGWGMGGWNRVALIGITILLAWLTKIAIEDPAREWGFFVHRKPRFTYMGALALMGVSTLAIGAAWATVQPKFEAAAAQLEAVSENPPECFGVSGGPDCVNPELAGVVIPDAGFGNADKPGHVECFVQLAETEARSCTFGSTEPGAPRIALIGDSHAYQYIEAVIEVAESNGWSLTTYLKGACPWTTAPVGTLALGATDSCSPWRANVADALAAEEPFDAVITTALATTPYRVSAQERDAVITQGFVDAWGQARGAEIVVIADNPVFSVDPNKCLKVSAPSECTESRAFALAEVDGVAEAARAAGAVLIDFTDQYCTVEVCRSVVGGANVYRDKDHLTNTFVLTMKPAITEALKEALAR